MANTPSLYLFCFLFIREIRVIRGYTRPLFLCRYSPTSIPRYSNNLLSFQLCSSNPQELHGIPLDPDLIQTGDYSRKTGFACAQRLLNLPDPPTAIFASNDQSATGAIEAIHEAGLRVPDDISVVGFDNIPDVAYTHPGLTTVDQSIDTMGYIATEMLVSLIEGDSLESDLYKVPTRLIVRDSCRSINDTGAV